jgi:hypothetical protein
LPWEKGRIDTESVAASASEKQCIWYLKYSPHEPCKVHPRRVHASHSRLQHGKHSSRLLRIIQRPGYVLKPAICAEIDTIFKTEVLRQYYSRTFQARDMVPGTACVDALLHRVRSDTSYVALARNISAFEAVVGLSTPIFEVVGAGFVNQFLLGRLRDGGKGHGG